MLQRFQPLRRDQFVLPFLAREQDAGFFEGFADRGGAQRMHLRYSLPRHP